MIGRRSLFAMGMASLLTQARAQNGIEMPKPYLQVPTVSGDERVIRIFFSPSCQYSRMYVPFFKNLSATLPADRRLIYTPVVNKGDGISYALAYAAVVHLYPTLVDQFIEASMVAVQDNGIATSSWGGIDRIGLAAGVPERLPQVVHRSFDVFKNSVRKFVELRHNLQVTNTPAVAVAGTYVVTPEITKGDAALFSQLVNGIISMAR